jgi:EpsI family protein
MRKAMFAIGVPLVILAQGLFVRAALREEKAPAIPKLDLFPKKIGDFQSYSDVPMAPATQAILKADSAVERLYFRQASGVTVDFFVAWFQSQKAGDRQPHSPKVCLPGSGWVTVSSEVIPLKTSAGEILVNRYLVRNGNSDSEVFYWYQSSQRVTASELSAKFFTVADGLRYRRTDTAVVRVTVAVSPGGKQADDALLFASGVYPVLKTVLPQ